ncbi:vacuolar import and degradation protein-domain-containing protein [Russula earlei]|uniref:Vacuolar import and degradation protein-domain-containing protein n=1 Tax=Russula earlei TaxID=71964 RepID=A0ACC0U9A0_9AGAM|nr:vacuolar import and degradation protein-domain-containing protein [Russula earlei]
MPVSPAALQQHQDIYPQSQVKLCSSCRSPLSQDLDPNSFFPDPDLNDHPMLCRPCKERYLLQIVQQQIFDLSPYSDVDDQPHRLHPYSAYTPNEDAPRPPTPDGHVLEVEAAATIESLPSLPPPPSSPPSDRPSKVAHEALLSSAASKRAKLAITTSIPPDVLRSAVSSTPSIPSSIRSSNTPQQRLPAPDPYVDVTRVRMRSQGHHCLYPGATFQGTQKSGRNSYDVTVSIVDVDFSSSFLCGYLCIRGLTDDWPELTTYFDAEIIGSRYGFLTRGWGADEDNDMVHWARFPAFRHERFLVPDHRVQDINGASFAGFYYVCVDFNSHTQTPITPTRQPSARGDPDSSPALSPLGPKSGSFPSTRGSGSSLHEESANSHRAPSLGTRSGSGVATMSGFYFHQNSEPYQQLSLQHVPENVSTSFELR